MVIEANWKFDFVRLSSFCNTVQLNRAVNGSCEDYYS